MVVSALLLSFTQSEERPHVKAAGAGSGVGPPGGRSSGCGQRDNRPTLTYQTASSPLSADQQCGRFPPQTPNQCVHSEVPTTAPLLGLSAHEPPKAGSQAQHQSSPPPPHPFAHVHPHPPLHALCAARLGTPEGLSRPLSLAPWPCTRDVHIIALDCCELPRCKRRQASKLRSLGLCRPPDSQEVRHRCPKDCCRY